MDNKAEKEKEEILIRTYISTGNQRYLAELFDPYVPLIYGLCLKYFKNTHDAEDAVMDIYLGIREKLKKHDVKNFRSWLYVVSKNHCLDKLRSRGSKLRKEKEAQLMYSEEVFHPDSVDGNSGEVRKLMDCMEKLPEEQKICLDLFYFKKIPYREITALTSYTWGQVRSFIQNGRRNLKICMEKT